MWERKKEKIKEIGIESETETKLLQAKNARLVGKQFKKLSQVP